MSRGFLVVEMLKSLGLSNDDKPIPFETHFDYMRRIRKDLSAKKHRDMLYYLKRQGLIKSKTLHNKKLVSLTKKGALKILLTKASKGTIESRSDGLLQLIIFDIPENPLARNKRDVLRRILKKLQFKKLQASVYYRDKPIPQEAKQYLKESGLNRFIISLLAKFED